MDLRTQPELSLEPLLLRYHSAAAASSLWTCVAVFAAAVYFWRVRSSSVVVPSTVSHRIPEASPRQCPPENPIPPLQCLPENPISPPQQPEYESKTSFPEEEDSYQMCFATKGTIFQTKWSEFEEKPEIEDFEPSGRGIAAAGGDVVVVYGGGSTTRVLGWYKHQNVTALNGNVVRLWDDVRRSRF